MMLALIGMLSLISIKHTISSHELSVSMDSYLLVSHDYGKWRLFNHLYRRLGLGNVCFGR